MKLQRRGTASARDTRSRNANPDIGVPAIQAPEWDCSLVLRRQRAAQQVSRRLVPAQSIRGNRAQRKCNARPQLWLPVRANPAPTKRELDAMTFAGRRAQEAHRR